jgi:nucleoside-diphosphate-sugar epimerase
VTGGAGFIGSHLAEELLRRGHHVRVVDNLSTGKRVTLAAPAAEFVHGDLAVGEQYWQMFTRLYGLPMVCIRYFVFGPRQDPQSPYSCVIALFASAQLAGRRPAIDGGGSQTRDFTYLANVVDAVLRACEAPDAAGEFVNVVTGQRISFNDLLRAMNRLLGTDIRPEYQAARADDVHDSQADISKAAALFGYEPIVSLTEGLERTLAWCRDGRQDHAWAS